MNSPPLQVLARLTLIALVLASHCYSGLCTSRISPQAGATVWNRSSPIRDRIHVPRHVPSLSLG